MAREIVTRIWCDPCMNEGEQVEGEETPPIALGAKKPRVMALCERHRKELYDPLADALADLGQIVDGPASAAPSGPKQSTKRKYTSHSLIQEPFVCKVPGCGSGDFVFANRGALTSHLRQQHDLLVNEYAAKYLQAEGDPELDLSTDAGDSAPVLAEEDWTCGVELEDGLRCDKAYPPARYRDPQRLIAIHKSKEHGIRGKSAKKKAS